MNEHAGDRPAERTRLAALLALNAPRRPATAGSDVGPDADAGPDDADLAALIDGRLSGAERERVLTGLAASPAAYRVWLAAAAQVRAQDGVQVLAQSPAVRPAKDRTGTAMHTGRVARRRRAAGALAAAVLVAAVGWWVWLPPPLERDLGSGFAALAGGAGPLPESFASLGLVSRGRGAAQDAAALAGYRSGLAALRTPGVTAVPAPAGAALAGYRFGRWVALLEAAAVAEPSPGGDFWAGQVRIGQRLAAEFGDDDPASALGLLNAALARRGEDGPDWRRDLARQVRTVRLRLGLDWEGSAAAP